MDQAVDFKQQAVMVARWRHDPVLFVQQNFGVESDKWQAKALEAYADPTKRRLALSACAGPGKSALLAWCCWHFLACWAEPPDHHPKGFAISCTLDNLKTNLWSELKKWMDRSPFLQSLFVWTQEKIFHKDNPGTWFITARSFPRSAHPDQQAESLSGLHGKYVLAIIDESGGISRAVMRRAEQSIGGADVEFGKIIQAGNPTSQAGMLYAATREEPDDWTIVKITGDPEDPDRSERIDIEWARHQIAKHGRDHPWIQAFILGEFPKTAIDSLLSAEQVAESMARAPRPDQFVGSQKRIGIDAARFGDDPWIIIRRQGLIAYPPDEMKNPRTHEVVGRVLYHQREFKSEVEFIDVTGGYGAGVEDGLIRQGRPPVPVQFSGKAIDPRYGNKRSEMWFGMAEWIKRGGALPKDDDLAKELVAPTFYYHRDKLFLEDKEQIKRRLGGSPDRADALALTFALPEQDARSEHAHLTDQAAGRVLCEYDPLQERSGKREVY